MGIHVCDHSHEVKRSTSSMVLATEVGTGQSHIQPCADKAGDGLKLDQKGTMPEQPGNSRV